MPLIQNNHLFIVYAAKAIRTFGFGSISVVFALFLHDHGLSTLQIGAVISATLVEDALLTALVSMYANAFGVKLILVLFSCVLAGSGLIFAFSGDPWIIAITSVLGIISPSGFEGGPFSAIEQALISKVVPADRLARVFSNYNLIAFASAALGALATGPLVHDLSLKNSYQPIFLTYAFGGLILVALYSCLANRPNESGSSPAHLIEKSEQGVSKQIWALAALQGIDAFGGGFIPQTLISFWFTERFHVGPEFTGPVFFVTYILAAISLTIAPLVCRKYGLLNTIVFSHLPCSLSLCIVPLMPTATLASLVLILRSLFSSMDIPARQTYSMLIVPDDKRTSVAGLTSAARSIGQCIAPLFSGLVLTGAWSGMPFLYSGCCKTLYDCGMYLGFRKTPLHEREEIVDD